MAEAQVEICLLWGNWQIQQWWSCMTKTEWAGWLQFVGAVTAIGVAFWIARHQISVERRRDARLAASLIMPFAGALQAVNQKLPPGGSRSLWDMRMTRMMLESELKRSDTVPLDVLTSRVHLGFYSYRLLAMQLIEAFKIAEEVLDKPTDPAAGGALLVRQDAYEFVQDWINRTQTGIQDAHKLVGSELEVMSG